MRFGDPLTRRSFAGVLLSSVGLRFFRPATTSSAVLQVPELWEPSTEVAKILGNTDSARIVGEEYLRRVPEERSRHKLLLHLPGRPAMREGSAGTDATRWREALASLKREDFEKQRVQVIDGWVLARTEARLCALVALS